MYIQGFICIEVSRVCFPHKRFCFPPKKVIYRKLIVNTHSSCFTPALPPPPQIFGPDKTLIYMYIHLLYIVLAMQPCHGCSF